LTAVCFSPCHLTSSKRSIPSDGKVIFTSRATLFSVASPFQIVLPRCEISNVKGTVVEVRTSRTLDCAAGALWEISGGSSVRWVVKLRNGQRTASNATTTNKTRSSGDPLIRFSAHQRWSKRYVSSCLRKCLHRQFRDRPGKAIRRFWRRFRA